MFWPLVLPFKITFAAMLAILIGATLAAPLARVRRMTAFFAVSGVAIVTFIPACTAVMKKIDATRFGEFQYASVRDMSDEHAALYIPPTATNIQTLQKPNGIWATFQIDEPSLIKYVQNHWDAWGDSAVNWGEDWKLESDNFSEIEIRFRDIEWDLPDLDVAYTGPTAADGAGYQIWYHRESQTGILWGIYW